MNGTYLLVAFIVGAAVLAIIFKQSSLQGDWPIQSNALAYAMETFEEDVATTAAEEPENGEGEEDVEGYEGEEDEEDAELPEGYEGYEERAATDEHGEDAVEGFAEGMKAKKLSFKDKLKKNREANKAKKAMPAKPVRPTKNTKTVKTARPAKTEIKPDGVEMSEGIEGFEESAGQMPYLGIEYAAI